MGAHSTIKVTRSRAMAMLLEHIAKGLSDEALERFGIYILNFLD